MKYLLSALAASLMLSTLACNRTNEKAQAQTPAIETMQLEDMPPPDGRKKSDDQVPFKVDNNAWDKKIIRNAQLNVEVQQFAKYREQIREVIERYEGYVANEEESGSSYERRTAIMIKVPSARLDEALSSIAQLKGKVLSKRVTSDDVTAEVFDTRARIEAKKKVRVHYLEMLQKAKNIEEILQVEREINQLQEQIEAAEGRLNYLNHSTSMSTIQLTFFEVLIPDTDTATPGYGKRILLALNEGLSWLANLLVLLATLWPLWILIITIWIAVKRLRPARINTAKNS